LEQCSNPACAGHAIHILLLDPSQLEPKPPIADGEVNRRAMKRYRNARKARLHAMRTKAPT